MKRILEIVVAALIVVALVSLLRVPESAHGQAALGGIPFQCSLDGIGATLTLCYANGDPEMKMLITDITAQSTTGTSGQMLLRYGTGTNCATGTTSLYPSAATAVRFNYPLSSGAPMGRTFGTPLIVPAGKDLCAIGIATQLLVLQIQGVMVPQ